MPANSPACSAAPPWTWPPSSAPPTRKKWCTGTIWCSCDQGEEWWTMSVAEQGQRAKVAATVLATASRRTKDAALVAMAGALRTRTDEILAANAADVERAQAAGTPAHLID